jgi:hypothetical protein
MQGYRQPPESAGRTEECPSPHHVVLVGADIRPRMVCTAPSPCTPLPLVYCGAILSGRGTEKPLNVRDLGFQVAVRATADGRFTFQIFTLSGEPRTFHAGSQTYATPADAASAGYEAIAAKRL